MTWFMLLFSKIICCDCTRKKCYKVLILLNEIYISNAIIFRAIARRQRGSIWQTMAIFFYTLFKPRNLRSGEREHPVSWFVNQRVVFEKNCFTRFFYVRSPFCLACSGRAWNARACSPCSGLALCKKAHVQGSSHILIKRFNDCKRMPESSKLRQGSKMAACNLESYSVLFPR